MPEVTFPAVTLWFADLTRDCDAQSATSLMTGSEVIRARRFARDLPRRRFILRRVLRRLVLAEHLSMPVADVSILENGRDKPRLAGGGVEFNTSHSADHWVMAVAEVPIGIDVEAPRPLPELDALIDRTCAPAEKAALHRLARPERESRFFDYWVVKEAIAKLTGEGLSAQIDAMDAGADPFTSRLTYAGQEVFLQALDAGLTVPARLASHRPVQIAPIKDAAALAAAHGL